MTSSLARRIFEISNKHSLSHIGSCITAVDIIDEIYSQRQPDEPFILSCGHAGLALYVVLEQRLGIDAEALFAKHGVHPNKDLANGIWCSTGSLGAGITISVGHALAIAPRNVWCLISDAEAEEGSVYEALRFAHQKHLDNLKVYVNANGYGAYHPIDRFDTFDMLESINPNIRCRAPEFKCTNRRGERIDIPFLKGINAHYCTMNAADWRWVEDNL